MTKEKLMYLLTQREGPKLDFKEDFNLELHQNRKELAKDIVAMANTHGGRGYLIYGVQDKTKQVIGVDINKFSEERIQQVITMTIDPPVNIRVEFFKIEKKDIVTITVFKSHKQPHQSRQTGAFYIRRGSTTDTARIDEITALFQKSSLIGNEKLPIYDLDTSVLEEEKIREYLEKRNLAGAKYDQSLLSDLGILSYDRQGREYFPTLGGVLFFTDIPQHYLNHVGIKIIHEQSQERKIMHLEGNLMTLYKNTIKIIESIIDWIPLEGLKEAIINCIIHRDYFDYTREIVIYISKKQIIMTNPGSAVGHITLERIMQSVNQKRRNFWIYQTFLTLDDEHRLLKNKNGLNFIRDYYDGFGHVKFLSSRELNIFKMSLTLDPLKESNQ